MCFCCWHLYRNQRHTAWCVSVVDIFIAISDIQLDVVLRCLPHLQPEQRYPKSLPSLSPRSDRIHCRKGTVHNLSEGTLRVHLSITWHLRPGHPQRSQGGQQNHEITGTSPADCMPCQTDQPHFPGTWLRAKFQKLLLEPEGNLKSSF